MLSGIDPSVRAVQALILTPTRELAIQVAEAIERLGTGLPHIHVVQLYGGAPYGPQLQGLRRGAQIVVGTPGRIADHLEKRTLDLRDVGYFVLDEADEMLQMGFLEEVEAIFDLLPADRQVALFSATMPNAIREVSRKHLTAPAEVSIKSRTQTAINTRQRYVVLPERQKADALARILQVEDFDAALVFVRTRQNTTDVTEALNRRGFSSVAISSDLSQPQREKTIAALRAGEIDVLVATDVAARGLDVDRISLVVNHDLPPDSESYVHRIGRTGRVGRWGRAITFVEPRQRRDLEAIERHANTRVAPWAEGARVAPVPLEEPPRRHSKPRRERPAQVAAPDVEMGEKGGSAPDDPPMAKLILSGGQAAGIEPADLVAAITRRAGLEGGAVRNVRVLQFFALAEVPAAEAARVVSAVGGTRVRGHELVVETARG